MSPEEIIQLLHLTPLTGEGGMVAETYTSEEVYGNRRCGSAIYYMLTKNSFSHLHMLSADEIWHFYYGDPVELIQIRDCDGRRTVSVLGQDIRNGERPQILVEKNSWQGAGCSRGEGSVLPLWGLPCLPPIWKEISSGRTRETMIRRFPDCEKEIKKVTGELVYR